MWQFALSCFIVIIVAIAWSIYMVKEAYYNFIKIDNARTSSENDVPINDINNALKVLKSRNMSYTDSLDKADMQTCETVCNELKNQCTGYVMNQNGVGCKLKRQVVFDNSVYTPESDVYMKPFVNINDNYLQSRKGIRFEGPMIENTFNPPSMLKKLEDGSTDKYTHVDVTHYDNVINTLKCQTICNDNSSCMGFVGMTDQNTNECIFLKQITNSNTPSAAHVSYQKKTGSYAPEYVVLNNMENGGEDIETLQLSRNPRAKNQKIMSARGSERIKFSCGDECNQNKECVGYTVDANTGSCTLKKGFSNLAFKHGSRVHIKPTVKQYLEGKVGARLDTDDLPNAKRYNVDEFDKCFTDCEKNDSCAAVVMKETGSGRFCRHKTRVDESKFAPDSAINSYVKINIFKTLPENIAPSFGPSPAPLVSPSPSPS